MNAKASLTVRPAAPIGASGIGLAAMLARRRRHTATSTDERRPNKSSGDRFIRRSVIAIIGRMLFPRSPPAHLPAARPCAGADGGVALAVAALLRAAEKQSAEAAAVEKWRSTLKAGGKLTVDDVTRLQRMVRQLEADQRVFRAAEE